MQDGQTTAIITYNLSIAIVFHGNGKRISDDDINCCHKSVEVYWQQSAWIDTKLCADRAKNTFTPAMEDKQGNILFCNNVEEQIVLHFQEEVRK